MRLTDLDPEWIYDYQNVNGVRYRGANDTHSNVQRHDDDDADLPRLTIEQVQGVMFLCPVCFVKNKGPIGTESVLCWFKDRGVPDEAFPGPGRWTASGTSLNDLTLHPSVNVDEGHWHGWIKNGEVT